MPQTVALLPAHSKRAQGTPIRNCRTEVCCAERAPAPLPTSISYPFSCAAQRGIASPRRSTGWACDAAWPPRGTRGTPARRCRCRCLRCLRCLRHPAERSPPPSPSRGWPRPSRTPASRARGRARAPRARARAARVAQAPARPAAQAAGKGLTAPAQAPARPAAQAAGKGLTAPALAPARPAAQAAGKGLTAPRHERSQVQRAALSQARHLLTQPELRREER